MEKLIDIEFALDTYKRYHTTQKHIQEFIEKEYLKDDIPIQDINLRFIKGFEYFLKETKRCNHNSVLKYVNNVKKIIRMAVGNEWITKDPFYNYKIKFKNALILCCPSTISYLSFPFDCKKNAGRGSSLFRVSINNF